MKIQRSPFWLRFCGWPASGALLGAAGVAFPQSIQLSDSQAERIGRRLWQNESGGTIAGLTAWNFGEDFASLGIGHFIWYPANKRGPFEESFPPLLEYLVSKGLPVPQWLKQADACPWSSRAPIFSRSAKPANERTPVPFGGNDCIPSQICRVKIGAGITEDARSGSERDREKIRENFDRVAGEPQGLYALVDYVNFKGEGTLASERYQGEGWGLLQVLEEMGKGRRRWNSAGRRTRC